jgi:hypothetical protein
MHPRTVYMEYSECLPTLLNPLAEWTCFSQAGQLHRRLVRELVGGRSGPPRGG